MSEIIGGIGKAIGTGVKAVGAGIRSSPSGLAEAGRLARPKIEAPRLRRVESGHKAALQPIQRLGMEKSSVNDRIGAIRGELAAHEIEDQPQRIIIEKEDEKNGFLSEILFFIARTLMAVFSRGKEVTELGIDIAQDPLTQEAISPRMYEIKPRIGV